MCPPEKICVLMPTYNNGGTLRDVLERVLAYCHEVIVVNDGCTDHSAEILASFGERITVVDYGCNQGKGYALKQGFKKAKSKGFEKNRDILREMLSVGVDGDGIVEAQFAGFPKALFQGIALAFVFAVIDHGDTVAERSQNLR